MNLDNVAVVKQENGMQFAHSRKKDRGLVMRFGAEADGERNGNEIFDWERLNGGNIVPAKNGPDGELPSKELSEVDSLNRNHLPNRTLSKRTDESGQCLERTASDAVKQEILPGSGYGTDSENGVETGSNTYGIIAKSKNANANGEYDSCTIPSIYVSGATDNIEMGNINNNKSNKLERNRFKTSRSSTCNSNDTCIPDITVIEASPVPVEAGATVFNLLENKCCIKKEQNTKPKVSGDSFKKTCQNNFGSKRQHDNGALDISSAGDQRPTSELVESKTKLDNEPGCIKGTPKLINKRRSSRGSPRSLLSNNPSLDGGDDGQCDPVILCANECTTPRSSRKNFIQLMMNSSPQVRRSMVLKNNCYVLAKDSGRSDSDTGFIITSAEEDGGSVALDPLEHEWMMCASDGEWEPLHQLLLRDPNLINKKDFVTGFTCLHWSAKLGREELLALLMNFAKKNAVSVNVNARSSAGYTPLHLAAMHKHLEVVKLLVGVYDADVEVRDYSGKTASQYLPGDAPEVVHDIIGGKRDFCGENDEVEVGRWTLSKVISSNLIPFVLFNHPEEDMCDIDGSVKPKLVNKKPSMNIIKPRLPKIRVKSRIVHSTSFRDPVEVIITPQNLRPKSNLFG